MGELTRNTLNSLKKKAKQVITEGPGKAFEFAADKTVEMRKVVCYNCEELFDCKVTKGKRCKQCGCFVDAKIQLNIETCPKGKW